MKNNEEKSANKKNNFFKKKSLKIEINLKNKITKN